MALKDDIALLRHVPAFKGLEDDQLRLIAFGAERRRLAAGETLYEDGAVADGAYVVAQGRIMVGGNGTVEGALATPGDMLSEFAMISETRRQASAVADGPAEVLRIPRALFLRMVEEYPDVGRMTEARLRRSFSDMVDRLAALKGRFG